PGVARPVALEPRIPYLDLRLHHHWHPHFGPVKEFGAVKVTAGNTQHGERLAVNANGLADNVAIATKPLPPRRVAQHCIPTGSGLEIVFGMKETPERWFEAQHIKIIACRQVPPNVIGAVA